MVNLSKRILLISFIVLLSLIVCVIPTVIQSSQAQGRKRFDDDSVARKLKKNGMKYTTNRAVLWVEKNHLSEYEIKELSSRIESGIIAIEKYLGLTFDKERYKDDKIHYFIEDGKFVPHVYGSYHHREFRKPMVFIPLFRVKRKRNPYLHETVHIVAWDFRSLWIREGLAVYLNDKLGGYPAFPNFGKDIDECAKEYLSQGPQGAFKLIGRNGIPDLSDIEKRTAFYSHAGSFVKFIDEKIGIEKLMNIYKARDTKKAFKKISGQTVEEWKKAWVNSLGG